MKVADIKLYERLRHSIGEEEAQELVGFIHSQIENEFMDCKDIFLTKDDKLELMLATKQDKAELIQLMKQDKIDLIRTIYIVGVVQFLAIIGAVIGIVNFMLKK